MSCKLDLKFTEIDNITKIWKDFAKGFLYESDISSNECLKKLIEFANQINHDSKSHVRKEVLNRILRRGIQFRSRINNADSDTTEIIGLTGEMITENFLDENGYENFYIKWRNKGTSKSKGIDMIVIKQNADTTDFFLIESKHIHSITGNVSTEIKKRFEDGIGEFEHDKTIYDLAGLSTEFSIIISKNRQFGHSVDELEKKCEFLEERMNNEDYKINIFVCIDHSKYNETDFKKLMKSISSPTDIGDIDYMGLNILKIKTLESITTSILGGN